MGLWGWGDRGVKGVMRLTGMTERRERRRRRIGTNGRRNKSKVVQEVLADLIKTEMYIFENY